MPAPYSNTVAEGSAAIARGMNDSSTTGRSPMSRIRSYTRSTTVKSSEPSSRTTARSSWKIAWARTRVAPSSERARRSASSNSSPMPSPPVPAGEPAGFEQLRQPLRADHVPHPLQPPAVTGGVDDPAERRGRLPRRPRPHRRGQLSRAVLFPCHGGDRVPALRARLAGGVGVGRAGSGEHVHPAVVDDLPRPVGRRRAERAVPDRPFDARPAQGHLAGPGVRLHALRRREAARPLGRHLPLVAAAPDARLPIGSRIEPAHRAPSPAVNCSIASSGLTRRSSRGAR